MKQIIKTCLGAISVSLLPFIVSAQVAGDSPTGQPTPAPTNPTGDSPTVQPTPSRPTNPTGDSPTARPTPSGQANPYAQGKTQSKSTHVGKVSDLIGMDVAMNGQEEKLGTIKELAVDVESGRIVAVILTRGGFLGIGASATALPPGVLTRNDEKKMIHLNAGKEQLENAPAFDSEKWANSFSKDQISAIYKQFGQESAMDFVEQTGSNQGNERIPASRLEKIQRSSQVIGLRVRNQQDEAVGVVEEILADLSSGRVTALAVSSGDFVGKEGELSLVPATAFKFNEDRSALQLDTTKEKLEAAPHFKENNWPDFSQPSTIDSIFSAHSVEPYKVSAQQTQSSNARPAATQGSGKEDMSTTSAIRNEISALSNISVNARNVTVSTKDGTITLSGRVDTSEEKRIISEIAQRNAGDQEVDNRLEVRAATTTTATTAAQ